MGTEHEASFTLEDLNQQGRFISKVKVYAIPFVIVFPFICAGISALVNANLLGLVFTFLISAALGSWPYMYYTSSKFMKLKGHFKRLLLKKYMEAHYPDIAYVYRNGPSKGSTYLSLSNLAPMLGFAEEDVIEGKYGEVDFYLSQIYSIEEDISEFSRNASKDSDWGGLQFRGMLLELRSSKFRFPETTIRSNAGLLRKSFQGYKVHEKYQFAYKTENEEKLAESTAQIIPFIAYLKAKHHDIKILLSGDRILMMLSTDMDFLDEPPMIIGDVFTYEKYYSAVSRHLNSMFFVLESLIGKESPLELEEKLALRVKKKLLG